MRLDTLFLDAGGVLVNPNWERVSEALAQHGIRVEAAALAAAEPHAKRVLDVPAKIAATSDAERWLLYFDLVLGHAGISASPATHAALVEIQAYHARRNLWESVPDEVAPALERFRAAGLCIVVVSNANGALRLLMERTGLLARVDHVVDSHVEGVEKPDPRIFEIALARAGARPERTLHVGDFFHIDVVGARRAGIAAALVDTAGLYPDHDCLRVPTLTALADLIEAGQKRLRSDT